jgi:type IV pilus assembly protein PilC
MVYVGFVVLCLFLVPRFENFFDDLGIETGFVLQVLQALRDSLPVWIAMPPILLLVLYLWRRSRSHHQLSFETAERLAWLPGMSQSLFQQRCASFAEVVATLLESGARLEESLRLAATSCGDRKLADGARRLAETIERAQTTIDRGSMGDAFPPFLRWALLDSSPAIETPRALRMAADVYRESAGSRMDRLQVVAPVAACIVLGGGVTLLYGLALFVPVSDMLRKLGS